VIITYIHKNGLIGEGFSNQCSGNLIFINMIDPKISKWTGQDKLLHLILGFFIMVFGGWISLLIAAIGKEVWDEYTYGGADYKDFIATIVGGLFVFLI
jgi:hypothetical protein